MYRTIIKFLFKVHYKTTTFFLSFIYDEFNVKFGLTNVIDTAGRETGGGG